MNRTQVTVAMHLLSFIAVASLAYNEGQDLQRWWVIHPIIICFLFFPKLKGKPKEIYARLFYLSAIPTMYLYKFISSLQECNFQIPVEFWVLNISSSILLYIAGIFLFLDRNKYISYSETSAEPSKNVGS